MSKPLLANHCEPIIVSKPIDTQDLEAIATAQNHYVSHLANLDEENEVTTTEDIRNVKGVLVVCKGARISQSVAEQVLKHKLLKPLEDSVQFRNCISQADLLNEFQALFMKYSDVRRIHVAMDYNDAFQNLVLTYPIPPILLQKLTVFRAQMPKEFEKSLFTAWLSSAMIKQFDADPHQMQVAYLAGLTHDIGLLHISPEIINKKEKLEAHEWRAIQSHVVVAQLILKNLPQVHADVARAVMEHHEQCDGSGYPLGKTKDELSFIGQVVAMADSIQAIRVNQFTRVGRNLGDALPYLHMNQESHFFLVYRSVYSMIREAKLGLNDISTHVSDATLINHLYQRGEKLQDATIVLKLIQHIVLQEDKSAGTTKFIGVLSPVIETINRSGLVSGDIIEWLATLAASSEPSERLQLIEMELMQNELCWQVKKSTRAFSEYLESIQKKMHQETYAHLFRLSNYINEIVQSL